MRAKDLKNSILQLAVSGKLVPQDASDEPAVKLLERIRAERNNLIKQKKIKNTKVEPITEEDIPFEVPESWEWVRLSEICNLNSGLGYKKDNLSKKGSRMIRVLRGGNITDSDSPAIKEDDIMISDEYVKEELLLRNGQIITPAVTSLENVSKAAIITNADNKTVCGGFVFCLTPYFKDAIHSEYLLRYLTSPNHIEFCKSVVKKSGQAFYNLSKTSLNSALLPLPPLAEQKRIVQKVQEVMGVVIKRQS